MITTTTPNIEKINYRLFQQEDINGILQLWKENSGWGEITEKQFVDWHINTPCGAALIIVAETIERKIAGQMVFIPAIAYVNGERCKALKAMAPILNGSIRGVDIKSFEHPVYTMLRVGVQEATKAGYHLIYSLPSVGWLVVFRRLKQHTGLPISLHTYNCFEIPISHDTINEQPNEYYIQSGTFSEEYELLWSKVVEALGFDFAIARDLNWLKWKRGAHTLLEMRSSNDNILKGFIIIKNSGLVVELIAVNSYDMQMLIQLSINTLFKKNSESVSMAIKEIKFMESLYIHDAVQEFTCNKVQFTFASAFIWLKESEIPEGTWFIMPDD